MLSMLLRLLREKGGCQLTTERREDRESLGKTCNQAYHWVITEVIIRINWLKMVVHHVLRQRGFLRHMGQGYTPRDEDTASQLFQWHDHETCCRTRTRAAVEGTRRWPHVVRCGSQW